VTAIIMRRVVARCDREVVASSGYRAGLALAQPDEQLGPGFAGAVRAFLLLLPAGLSVWRALVAADWTPVVVPGAHLRRVLLRATCPALRPCQAKKGWTDHRAAGGRSWVALSPWSQRRHGVEPAKTWGVVAMMVLEYQLDCGCAQTVPMPVAQVEPEQITGDRAHVVHPLRHGAVRAIGTNTPCMAGVRWLSTDTGKPRA